MAKASNWLQYIWSDRQTRLVSVLTVFVSLVILAVGVTSYYTSKSVLQSELSKPQYQSLRIGMNYIDKYIQESNYTAIKVALHSNVYHFLMMEDQSSYNNVQQIYLFLKTLLDNSPYIESIYIYDRVRESFVGYPQGFSSRADTFKDSAWVDVADKFGERLMLVSGRQAPDAGEGGSLDQITLFRKVIIQGQFRGIVAINFKDDLLFSNMQTEDTSGLERKQFILDREGELLYAATSGGKGVEAAAVRDALSALNGEPFGDYVLDGERMLVSHAQSPVTEWEYVSFVSQEDLLARSKTIRNVLLAVSLAALLLGASAIVYTYSVALTPVRRMRKMLTTYGQEGAGAEPVDLENITGKLLRDHEKLSRLIRQTMPEASSKFLHDMFAGNVVTKKEIAEKWSSYFAEWTDAPLTVAVLSIDRYPEWAERFPEHDHVLLKFAITNIAAELLSGEWRSISLDRGADQTVILLQPISDKHPSLEKKLAEIVEVVERLLNFSLSAGFSLSHADPGKLKLALHEAENAAGYRLYRGYGSVTAYEDVAGHEMPETPAGDAALEDLASAVEAGAEERAQRIVERVIGEIREGYWYPSAALSFLGAAKAKLNRIARGKEAGVWEEDDWQRSLHTLALDDIGSKLTDEAKALASRFGNLIQSKEFIMVQHMIDYMKKHLGDNIGVQEIAASIGVSVSLASQLFKQETNETIHEYFTKLRIERAGELLIATGSKISDIALMVGYQHENSFIRVFRKYKDITPGKYRELMRNHDSSFKS